MSRNEQLTHEIFDFELGYICDATILSGYSQHFVSLKCLEAGVKFLKHLGLTKEQVLGRGGGV